MLEKVIAIDNVGVFQKGVPKAITLEKATLIYAENARGKSTLASILRACAGGDVHSMTARASIGGAGKPKVQLRFANGAGGANVVFDGGTWQAIEPRLQVFDQGFVDQNVYAGSEVNSDHHLALLDFALGSQAVVKKQEVEKQGARQVNATKARTSEEDKLKGYLGGSPLLVFLDLGKDEDADKTITSLSKRIANAKEATTITARTGPKELTIPEFDFDSFENVVASGLDNIRADASATVSKHLAFLGGPHNASWLSTGQALQKTDACPFCGQDTQGIELIEAYKIHFNTAYIEHSESVADLRPIAKIAISEASIDGVAKAFDNNIHFVAAWVAQLALPLPTVNFDALKVSASTIRTALLELADRKEKTPLEPVDTSGLEKARSSFADITKIVTGYNTAVAAANDKISAFKNALAGENGATLEIELKRAQIKKVRHSPEVVAIVAARKLADEDRAAAETAKATARKELDVLMALVLGKFQGDINRWLETFGVPFRIDKLKPTYAGGTPRTEYGIALRGSTVAAGKKAASAPSFETILSEGDKRTLAFSFFLAKLLGEKDAAQKIVVLDDVFTSLDRNRRTETVNAIANVAGTCAQVVVLGHDGYFLRELSKKLKKDNVCAQLCLHMRRAANNYSELDAFDLEEFCASDYYRRYSALQSFLAGEPTPDILTLATKLRPLFEGYLHRRFPGHIREGVTVGVVIGEIEKSLPGNPLQVLLPIVPKLKNLNDFTSAFHHDTAAGNAPRLAVTDAELQTYGERVMKLIHNGTI